MRVTRNRRVDRGLASAHAFARWPVLATVVLLAVVATDVEAQGTVAITGVTVVPMDRERTVTDQTVVVRDGRIVAVGPAASTEVPEGATRVDGRGRFLIPGLAEMHGHVPAVGQQGSQFAEDVLFLYVAAGATTVRGMQGNPTQFGLRDRVEAREIIGPRLVLSSPPLSGNNARDAATAERLVRQYGQQGFDLLKVHENIPVDAYEAIARTAGELDLTWGGHVSDIVGLHRALAAGQSTVDHVDNYVLELLVDPSAGINPGNVDDSRFAALANETREAGVAVVPTMALWEVLLGIHDPAAMADRPELRYMPAQTVSAWVRQVESRRASVDLASARLEAELRLRMLRALNEAGVRILMGTDAPQLFSVPGFSLDHELPVMASAGMTPFQILQSGTVNVAEHFGWTDAGTIAAGMRADLILLEANPLEDIRNVARRSGVMVAGWWLPAEDIRARLAAIAERNSGR